MDLKDSFDFFDPGKTGLISKDNLKSIMGNFGWTSATSKDIDDYIALVFSPLSMTGKKKDEFNFEDILEIVTRKYNMDDGKEAEFQEMFSIFDKRGKGTIALADFRLVFESFFDIYIDDEDIMDFIKRMSGPDAKHVQMEDLQRK